MIAGSKITDQHLKRTAYVYVRQSTPHQVREHLESKRRQYALRDKATDLGFKQVVVVDQDLGVSGSGTQERPGFGKLLAAVCEGTVGAVFALEASRLARNNRDWHHLVDLCALTDTVLVDGDGVYDPRLLNDRLLLGLKGTMSEFELGLLRQRAQAAFMDKVRRGAVLWEVPVGYVRSEDDGLEKTPDLQIQRAIEGVFAKFRELGTARQVTLWYREEKVPLPRVVGATKGREVTWQLPAGHYVRKLLKNPSYAGAHAYGCTEARSVFKDGRARRTARRRKPIDEWSVLIEDHHESYIKWEEFLRNQELLEANVAKWNKATGAPREGSALLSGLLRCGRCGRKLSVSYSGSNGKTGRYSCKGRSPARGSSPCLGVGSTDLDDAVAGVLLDAVQPAGVQAALHAIEQETSGRDEKREALELALQKARYEVTRAQRQYDACDPDNRLVASELEARWNAALKQVTDLEARLREFSATTPPLAPAERARLLDLGSDLFQLWNHPQASNKLRKRIARTLLEEIRVDLTIDPREVVLNLHWKGGVHTELRIRRRRVGEHRCAVGRDVLELVRELAKVCQDKDTARILNRLGFRTGQGNTWRASRVQSLRRYHDLPPASPDENALSLKQAAEALQVSNTVVRRLIKEGVLPAEQVVTYAPWIIKRGDLDLPEVKEAVEAVRSGRRRRPPRTSPGQTQLPFSQGQGKV